MSKREYVSMRGKVIDMELLKKMNELVPAVGNAKVNARGDEIGPGGKIIRKREDIVKDYYRNDPNQVIQESNKKVNKSSIANPVETPAPAPAPAPASKVMLSGISEEEKELIDNEDWVEDATGNFVKKEKSTRKPKSE